MPERYALIASAFGFLSFSRPLGFGAIGAIPISEMLAYHGLFPTGWPHSDFVEIIRMIDAEYLQHINADKPDGHRPNPRSSDRPQCGQERRR